MLLVPAMQETWYFQNVTGWSGDKQFELLSTKREGEGVVHDERYKDAEGFVLDMLANTSTMKLSHGPPGALSAILADLWDDPKNHHMDNEPGTFAEFLRYGSVHYNQMRRVLELLKIAPTTEEVLHVGVLEPKSRTNDGAEAGDGAREEKGVSGSDARFYDGVWAKLRGFIGYLSSVFDEEDFVWMGKVSF